MRESYQQRIVERECHLNVVRLGADSAGDSELRWRGLMRVERGADESLMTVRGRASLLSKKACEKLGNGGLEGEPVS